MNASDEVNYCLKDLDVSFKIPKRKISITICDITVS